MSSGSASKVVVSAGKKNTSSSIPRRDSTSSPIPQQMNDQKKKKSVKQQGSSDEIDVVHVDASAPYNKRIYAHRDLTQCPCEELCFFCKNTLTLQRANAFTETAIASDKLKQFSSFSKYLAGIDFDSVKNSLSAVHDLDVHLKHLLLNHDELKAHQNRTERVEANLSKISDIIDSNIQSTTKESIDTLSTNVQHLQDQLLAFTKSAPVLSSDTSATDHLLDRISKQLEELTINPPAPPPSEPSHSPQPLTPRITEATHHELHVHHSRDGRTAKYLVKLAQ
ncbi:hypothetical protein ACHWQZ_G017966 [Mnemiopsis leidyi]